MSSLRLLCASRFAAASKRTFGNPSTRRSLGYRRWQSTNPSPFSGLRVGRLITYTITASGLALGGAIVYANYDPVFKNRLDQYAPGFASLADSAADTYVGLVDSVGLGRKKDDGEDGKVGLALEKNDVRLGTVFGEGRKEKAKEKAPASPPVKEMSDKTQQQVAPPEREEISQPPAHGSTAEEITAKEGKEEGREKEVQEEAEAAPAEPSPVVPSPPPPPSSPSASPTVEGRQTEEEKSSQVVVQDEATEQHPQKKEEEEKEKGEESAPQETTVEEPVSVENTVEAARQETARVAGEMMEEKIREHQEAQMSDEHLSWLKESAQVGNKLEEAFHKFLSQTSKVLGAQKAVIDASKKQTQLVKDATSDHASVGDTESITDTADALSQAEESVQSSRQALQEAVEEHRAVSESLNELMNTAVELGLKSRVEEIEADLADCVSRLMEGSTAMQEAEAEREVLQGYRQQAERKREELQKELGTELPEGDSRQEALLLMLGRRVDVLRGKLEEMEKEHSEQLSAALERQRESLDELADQRLRWSLQKKEREMEQELKYMVDRMDKEYQNELREELRIQTDTHTKHLADALQTQADQLAQKWSHELELKLMEQENYYQKELARAMARLRGIEYMVNTIAQAGNETKRQQGMRAACDSLHSALQSASANPDSWERYSLTREVSDLREAAKDDPFIVAMLDSLPASATVGGGIQCEGGLRERFVRVKRMCRRVALVPEIGGGLGTYALSYLQSLLIMSWRFVGRVGKGGEDHDPHQMDTFEILECADALMRQGDLEQAVRYMNLLRGEPRRVAHDWLCDARQYLETTQAVLLISEYMAALNISSSPQ